MTRSTAREIAIHLAYQLSFTELPVEEFLDQQLSDERFAELAAEDDLYADRPNTKQEAYIRRLVSGVAEHAAELDADIEKYARGWRFERISLVASAIMRVAMYEILYMADIPQGAAISEAVTNSVMTTASALVMASHSTLPRRTRVIAARIAPASGVRPAPRGGRCSHWPW